MVDINEIYRSGRLFDDQYKLIRPLSTSGGSADVWLAVDMNTVSRPEDEDNATKVAIKIYRPKNFIDIEGEFQFRSEFRKVFNCHHENIIQPTYFSIYEEMPYLVLPYCPSGSSEALIGKLTDEGGLWKYIYEVASGLAYLHERNPQIIHQDIKPANVLIDDSGNYAITDFGISAELGGRNADLEDESGGTFAYMAPERFVEGAQPMPESDIWAFGATLYELITGDAPFGNDGGSVQNGTNLRDIDVRIPDAIRQLVMTCLSYDPSARPTARQIVDMVLERRYTSHRKKLIVATVASVLVLIFGLVLFIYKPGTVRSGMSEWLDSSKGLWLLPDMSSGKYAKYEFTYTNRLIVHSSDGKSFTERLGVYWVDGNRIFCNYVDSDNNKQKMSWEGKNISALEFTFIDDADPTHSDATMYRIVGEVNLEIGKELFPDYKSLIGTSSFKSVVSLDDSIVSVDRHGNLTGQSFGTSFILVKTSKGSASVQINVISEALSFEEYLMGTWIYDNVAEGEWQRTAFLEGGVTNAAWTYELFNLDETARGTYSVEEKSVTVDVVTESGLRLINIWDVKSINEFEMIYEAMSDGVSVGRYTNRKLLASVTVPLGTKMTLEYSKIAFGHPIQSFTSHNSGIASVDDFGQITGVALGRTYIEIMTDLGAAVVEVNVK